MFPVIHCKLHFADDLLDSHTVEADTDLGILLLVDISLLLAAKINQMVKEEVGRDEDLYRVLLLSLKRICRSALDVWDSSIHGNTYF